MDAIEKEIKNFIARERRALGLGRRENAVYPRETDFYLFLTDQLSGEDLERMLNHLKINPQDQSFVVTARKLISEMGQADQESVPADLIAKARSLVPQKEAVACPYCHRAITPFKKPLSRQKILNLAWLAAGICFLGLSFFIRRFFIQWAVLGALCVAKWIVDQKSTKTQIMIYKALSEESSRESNRLEKINRDAGI